MIARLLRSRATVVWLLLMAATVPSLYLGKSGVPSASGMVAIMLIAILKIRFVILDFMEIRHAPKIWRIIFETWLIAVAAAMTGLYLGLA